MLLPMDMYMCKVYYIKSDMRARIYSEAPPDNAFFIPLLCKIMSATSEI